VLAEKSKVFFVEAGLIPAKPDPEVYSWFSRLIDLLKNRVDHLDQLAGEAAIVYGLDEESPGIDNEARETLRKPEALAVAKEFARLVEERKRLTPEIYREIVGQVKDHTHQKGRTLFHAIRAALTGLGSGPELEKLIPLYEEGSPLNLPRKVMSCRERLHTILSALENQD
jgi:glutamyl/glutaminyl-tRNA synthetase